ncbi:Ig-like domain-containing protein [Halobacillus locisalis]|uniref:Ig-like domain-containing protein n=1 Tax=Halobacillus locisalis TaxID=220753 RepID=A0A838CUC1_9BACI|nr:Ig-like domain-containing protein [Halobacillus locisalis]MBA2175498.1 Ig-like domain-containing protein [Halobacillus locisalis]
MKNWIVGILIGFVLLGLTTSVSAADRTNVDLDKVWTITFNTEMDLNDDGIQVYDAQSQPVNVSLSYGKSKKKIMVRAEDPYDAGSTYHLEVNNKLTSSEGIAIQEEVNFTFETKAGASGLTNQDILALINDRTNEIQSIIGTDLNDNLGGERDFSRVEADLQQEATNSFVNGFLKDQYLNKACGGCDYSIFINNSSRVLYFEVLENNENTVTVKTAGASGYITNSGYAIYEFTKSDGKWLLNDYSNTEYSEDNYLNLTPEQGELYIENAYNKQVTYVRTVSQPPFDTGTEDRPYHVYEVVGEADIYLDTYTGFSERGDLLSKDPLSDMELKTVVEETVDEVHNIINGDINQNLGTDVPKDYDRVRPDLLNVATGDMVVGTLKEYYENACGACDYRYFQEPSWNLKYNVLVNDGQHIRLESASPRNVFDEGGFEVYDLVLEGGSWLLNGIEQRDFTSEEHLNVTAKEAQAYLETTDRQGEYEFLRTETKEMNNEDGFKQRPFHIFKFTGDNGATDQVMFDSYTGFTE